MLTVNNSIGKDNWSQRRNPDDTTTPWNETMETCNVTAFVTAAVTAAEASGFDMKKYNRGFHERPPMDLLYFMRQDKQCLALYNRMDPAHKYPMNEYMDILALAGGLYLRMTNKLEVRYSTKIDEIVKAVLRGDGIVIHGEYEFARKDGTSIKSGHFQSLAGMNYVVESKEGVQVGGSAVSPDYVLGLLALGKGYKVVVDSFIIDDPFGNPNTKYKDIVGDNVVMSFGKFVDQAKPITSKTAKNVIIIPKAVDGVYQPIA